MQKSSVQPGQIFETPTKDPVLGCGQRITPICAQNPHKLIHLALELDPDWPSLEQKPGEPCPGGMPLEFPTCFITCLDF